MDDCISIIHTDTTDDAPLSSFQLIPPRTDVRSSLVHPPTMIQLALRFAANNTAAAADNLLLDSDILSKYSTTTSNNGDTRKKRFLAPTNIPTALLIDTISTTALNSRHDIHVNLATGPGRSQLIDSSNSSGGYQGQSTSPDRPMYCLTTLNKIDLSMSVCGGSCKTIVDTGCGDGGGQRQRSKSYSNCGHGAGSKVPVVNSSTNGQLIAATGRRLDRVQVLHLDPGNGRYTGGSNSWTPRGYACLKSVSDNVPPDSNSNSRSPLKITVVFPQTDDAAETH